MSLFLPAFPLQVTVISTSPGKKEALRTLGAHHFLVSRDEYAMRDAGGSLDGIIDTVSGVSVRAFRHLYDMLDWVNGWVGEVCQAGMFVLAAWGMAGGSVCAWSWGGAAGSLDGISDTVSGGL